MIGNMGILLTSGCSFTYGDELPGTRRGQDENGDLIPDEHHHHTFTHKLSEKLGVNYVNLGQNGSSNQKIFRRTTTFLQQTSKEVEYMVITWSSWGRIEVFLPRLTEYERSLYLGYENCMNQIIPNHHSGKMKFVLDRWRDKEEHDVYFNSAKNFLENVYSMQTPIIHHLNYMCIMQDLCDLKGIKLIQGGVHHGMWTNILSTFKTARKSKFDVDEFVETLNFYLSYLRPECKIGFEGMDMTSIAEKNEGCVIHPMGHPCEKTHTIYADYLYDTFKDLK